MEPKSVKTVIGDLRWGEIEAGVMRWSSTL